MTINNELAQQIVDIIRSGNGKNIGTDLQVYFENKINAILPSDLKYYMTFNMSGGVYHHLQNNNGETVNF